MSEEQNNNTKLEETKKPKASSQEEISSQKISVEVKAKNPVYEIKVSTKSSISEIPTIIDGIIENIEKSKKFTPEIIERAPPVPQPRGGEPVDDPLVLFATQLEVDYNDLKKSKLISIKNQTAQILKPTALTPAESCYLLLAASEYALGKSSLSYDDWKELCEASKIKSKTPFYQVVDNAKRYGHINKKSYDKSREAILEPRGLETVKKAVSKYISNKPAKKTK